MNDLAAILRRLSSDETKNIAFVHNWPSARSFRHVDEVGRVSREDTIVFRQRRHESSALAGFSLYDLTVEQVELSSGREFIAGLQESLSARRTSFRVLAPHLANPVVRLLAANGKCAGITLLEDGLGSYFSFEELRLHPYFRRGWKKALRERWKIGVDLPSNHQLLQAHRRNLEAIALTDGAHPSVERRSVVEAFVRSPDLDRGPRQDLILIDRDLPPRAESYNAYADAVRGGLNRSMRPMIKFHPAISVETRIAMEERFGGDVDVLPGDFVLEEYFMKGPPLRVFSLLSSALIYARATGHSSVSFLDMFERGLSEIYRTQLLSAVRGILRAQDVEIIGGGS